jgi:hypothetical protein
MKKFYVKYSWLIIILLLALVFLKFCNSDPKPVTPIDLKPELKAQDRFRTVIRYHDSTRVQVLKKWKTITQIHDSVKCYEEIKYVIQACDTVLKVDSILISSLKAQHNNDTVIQVKLFERIRQDSVTITKLNKKVKRNRRMALFLGAVFLGQTATNLSREPQH